jgi:hypothetical protein
VTGTDGADAAKAADCVVSSAKCSAGSTFGGRRSRAAAAAAAEQRRRQATESRTGRAAEIMERAQYLAAGSKGARGRC